MRAITLDLSSHISSEANNFIDAEVQLSLYPFIRFVEEKANSEKTAKVNFYRYILDQFKQFPELRYPISTGDVGKYIALFELVHMSLSPIINDEQTQCWSIGAPLTGRFYYGTDAFYKVFMSPDFSTLKRDLVLPGRKEMEQHVLAGFYNLVMERYYGFSLMNPQSNIHAVLDNETQLLRYYRLDVDTRFIDIDTTAALPEYNLKDVTEYLKDEQNTLRILSKLIPPSLFNVSGIAIVTLQDVTEEYALESVKNIIIDHSESEKGEHSEEINVALRTLVGSKTVDFSMMPYLKLNKKLLINDQSGFRSILVQLARKRDIEEVEYHALIQDYLLNPRRLIFHDISKEERRQYPMLYVLGEAGIKSYALFPLYYNARLVGCLEMYTSDPQSFNGSTLTKIEQAFSLLAQLFHNIITDFNNEIQDVITAKFTTLQPAIQWRFNEAAYRYMQSGARERNLPVEPIYFKHVYPFYGAVDIRNSSVQRNAAIRKDLENHFEILSETLRKLGKRVMLCESDIPSSDCIFDPAKVAGLSDHEILKTEDYLLRQVPAAFDIIVEKHPEAKPIVEAYKSVTGPGSKIYLNRDRYEKSMQMINLAVTRHLDDFNVELQAIYPSYFEKFRTDGVEFDIYAGQSITPNVAFKKEVQSTFRLKQLSVLAEIAQTTNNLGPYFSLPLETTQLVFVYDKPIDVSFRIDEQRFDVEGSYNIRYQMVKKRIDKALIKNTSERLTQPGTIAIVYFDEHEAIEYGGYIKKLQKLKLLTGQVDHLEIEELQGVEGLKALRVHVNLNGLID